MNDDNDEAFASELRGLRDLLDDPSVWAEPDPSLEDRVVAAVTAEAAAARAHASATSVGEGSPFRMPASRGGHRSAPRRWLLASGALAAAAAVVVAVLVTAGSLGGGGNRPQMTAALSAAAPGGGSGSATFTRTSAGWRVELHTQGLARLDNGRFYEAWMKNEAGVLVAIGTFNQGPKVTLWSGVSPVDFGTITVTAQEANGNPASSGHRVLAGTIKGTVEP